MSSPERAACALYARIRDMDHTFFLEGEPCPGSDACFIVTGSWRAGGWGSDSRTYSAQLAIDARDLVTLLRHILARMIADLEERARRAVWS